MTASAVHTSASVYDVLRYAADQFASGAWGWHHAPGNPARVDFAANASCILTGICRAARELDSIQTTYDAVKHVEWYVRAPLGPWNDERGRTLAQVVDALRGAALLS